MRERITSAHILALIAIVMAVGGNAFAFTLGKNSVGTRQLKRNSVTRAKIKKQAVTAAKVKKGTLTGAQINASTLGTVPSAVLADNAQAVQGLTPEQIAATSKLRCPEGMVLSSGVCIETMTRPAVQWSDAAATCGQEGFRLPSEAELIAYEVKTYPQQPPYEWAGGLSWKEANAVGVVVKANTENFVAFSLIIFVESEPYRCAVNPLN